MSDPNNPTPDPNAQSGSQGGAPDDWVAGFELGDETKEALRNSGFDTKEKLAEGYLNLSKKLGTSVQPPGEGATEEQRREFFKKLGAPETAEGYELSPPNLPEGLQTDEAFRNAFKQAALQAGLTTTQARQVYGWYTNYMIDLVKSNGDANAKAAASTTETLQKEWGQEYEKEMALTLRAVDQFGGQELRDFFNSKEGIALGNHPVVIRAFNKIAHAVGEDNLVGGDGSGAAPEPTPGVLTYPSMKDYKGQPD